MHSAKLIFENGKLNLEFENIELKNSLLFSLISSKDIKASVNEELKRVKNDLYLIEAVFIAIDNYADVLLIIRNSDNPEVALDKLCSKYFYSREQGLFILELELTEMDSEIFITKKSLLINYSEFLTTILNQHLI